MTLGKRQTLRGKSSCRLQRQAERGVWAEGEVVRTAPCQQMERDPKPIPRSKPLERPMLNTGATLKRGRTHRDDCENTEQPRVNISTE